LNVAEKQNAVADFKARCKKINEFVAAIKNTKWQETARAIASKHTDDKADFEEFRTEALNAFDPAKMVEVPDTKIGMSKKERGQFSVLKLIRDIAYNGAPQGLEKEACETFRAKLDKLGDNRGDHVGYSLPDDVTEGRSVESVRSVRIVRATPSEGLSLCSQTVFRVSESVSVSICYR
jgi:hypothetical protein